MDRSLSRFRDDSKVADLKDVNPVALLLDSNFGKIAKREESAKPTVIYVNSYPDWVTTPEQRQSFTNMRDVARRYFAARSDLDRRLNWSYGRQYPSEYFRRGDVRRILFDAINIRNNLESEVASAERTEGMSDLGNMLRAMIQNSYRSLGYLVNSQDYGSFKQLNNENDRISTRVRQTFGIR